MPMRSGHALTALSRSDRKSTRLNSSHTVIYTLSLHDALPICIFLTPRRTDIARDHFAEMNPDADAQRPRADGVIAVRSEEHTSELQSHSDLHSFPTRRSSDLYIPYAAANRYCPRPLRRNESRCRCAAATR